MAQLRTICGKPIRVTGTGTVQQRSQSGGLLGITVPANTTGAEVSIWANTTASGTPDAVLTMPTTSTFLQIPMDCPTGFITRITGAASPDLTIYWWPV